MEMLIFWVETIFFHLKPGIYQQEGLVICLPVITNIYMEFFEEMDLGLASLKTTIWSRYIDGTFILWPHQETVQILLDHVNAVRTLTHFIMKEETKESSGITGCTHNLQRKRSKISVHTSQSSSDSTLIPIIYTDETKGSSDVYNIMQ